MRTYRRKLIRVGDSKAVTIPRDAQRYQNKCQGFFYIAVLSDVERENLERDWGHD